MNKLWIFCALLCHWLPGFCNDWPHFRGPNRNGAVETENPLKDKTFGFEIDWKKDLGSGYAAISVVGKTAVTMFSDETSDILIAFSAESGEEKWRYVIGPVYKGHSGSDDGPTGTPTIADGVVYALDPHGRMVAVTLADGKKLWERRLGEDLKARIPHYGFNTVPTILDDKVILMTGDEEGRAFTALNRKTGEVIWTSGSDTTTYQSPFIWEHDDKKHILGITDNHLMELDPNNGDILWKQEHKVLDNESYGMPLFVGENRVLISNRRETAVFQLNPDGKNTTMKELWRSNIISRTYAIPVYHKGYIYGFKSQFLACIDPETGKAVWRSRPPGGRGLTLLDGHLLIVGNDGRLVAVEATPEAYREKASIALFDQPSYTPVSYAGGHLFARNLKEMARVSITDKATQEVSQSQTPSFQLLGEFGKWVAEVMKADDKQAMVDAYMKKQTRFPIVEGSLVHYVYRGDQPDISVVRGFEQEKPMLRLEGTDLFFYSESLDPDSHWEYHFSVFGDKIEDPLNPLISRDQRGERHQLRMPQWKVPDYLGEPTGPRGRLETITAKSNIRNNEREVKVYLPPGYDDSNDRYPLLLVNSESMLNYADMDKCLDHLIGKSVSPVIVAFMPQLGNGEEFIGEDHNAYIRFLAEEFIPLMDKTFRTLGTPESRGLAGVGRGSVISVLAGLKTENVFGKLGLMSFVYVQQLASELKEVVAQARPGQEVFISISSNDYDFPGVQAEADCTHLAKTLGERGLVVKTSHHAGAPGWASWQAQIGPMMEALWPE